MPKCLRVRHNLFRVLAGLALLKTPPINCCIQCYFRTAPSPSGQDEREDLSIAVSTYVTRAGQVKVNPWQQGQLGSATADCKLTHEEKFPLLLCLSYDILLIFDLVQPQLSSIGVTGSNFET